MTNQNYIRDEIKCRLKAENSFYYSVQILCLPRVRSKIFLNTMFHPPMGRFQLELMYYFIFISSVNYPSQETEETSRPVENVVLTTKGLRERNTSARGKDGEK